MDRETEGEREKRGEREVVKNEQELDTYLDEENMRKAWANTKRQGEERITEKRVNEKKGERKGRDRQTDKERVGKKGREGGIIRDGGKAKESN